MFRRSLPLLVACAAALVTACTDAAKAPSEAALEAADAAFERVKAEAQKLVPAETEAVAKQIAEAKAQYAAQKYKEALAAATAAADKAAALGAAAAAKKTELMKAFNDALGQLSPLLDAAGARIEELKKMKKLPKGIEKDAVEKASAARDEIRAALAAADAKLRSGALEEAVAAAKALPARAQELVASLGAGEKAATR